MFYWEQDGICLSYIFKNQCFRIVRVSYIHDIQNEYDSFFKISFSLKKITSNLKENFLYKVFLKIKLVIYCSLFLKNFHTLLLLLFIHNFRFFEAHYFEGMVLSNIYLLYFIVSLSTQLFVLTDTTLSLILV